MLNGVITKRERGLWSADCALIGAYTQGTSRKDALSMLASLVTMMVGRDGFVATVSEAEAAGADSYVVHVDGSDRAQLLAHVLRYQREAHQLTLSQVAEKLGSTNHNAYAVYERGEREPSVSKFCDLLAVIAPEMRVVVAPAVVIAAAARPKAASVATAGRPRARAR